MSSELETQAELRCWRCSARTVCPYYMPGASCAYVEPTSHALRRLRRFHLYRTIGTIVAFAALATTVIPRAV